jgi:hypothetical protein
MNYKEETQPTGISTFATKRKIIFENLSIGEKKNK